MSKKKWAHFYGPTKIFVEYDLLKDIRSYLTEVGNRAFIIYIPSPYSNKNTAFEEKLRFIEDSLSNNQEGSVRYNKFSQIPTFDELDTAAYFFKRSYANYLVALGSTEAFNAAKVISILSNNNLFAADLVKNFQFSDQDKLAPIVIIPLEPTLGDESSPSLTLYDPILFKKSHIYTPLVAPSICLYDPKISADLENDKVACILGSMLAVAVEVGIKKDLHLNQSIFIREVVHLILEYGMKYYSKSYEREYSQAIFTASSLLAICFQNTPISLISLIAHGINTAQPSIEVYEAIVVIFPYLLEYLLPKSNDNFDRIATFLNLGLEGMPKLELGLQVIAFIRQIYSNLNTPTSLSTLGFDKTKMSEIVGYISTCLVNTNYSIPINNTVIEAILLAAV